MLYLAFHGAPGLIALDGDELSLEQLAHVMGTGFKGRVLHFGSCGTIKVNAERMATFLEQTGVAMVIGYQNNIDWVESASLDLLLFQWLQRYVRLDSLWTAFEKRYSGLVKLTGMSAVVA